MNETCDIKSILDRLTSKPSENSLASAGCMIGKNGKQVFSYTCGLVNPNNSLAASTIPFDTETRFRVASISKTLTARAVLSLALAGKIDLKENAFSYIGLSEDLKPKAGGIITISSLLNHTSSLSDRAGYYIDFPDSLAKMLKDNWHIIDLGRRPGSYFKYCNLNYVILGWILESVTQTRFDILLAKLVLEPLGIKGGFNWASVDSANRLKRSPIFRNNGNSFVPQIDRLDQLLTGDVVDRLARPQSLKHYHLGEDVSLFSPHAGARLSLNEILELATAFGDESRVSQLQRTKTWQFDPSAANGEYCDGLFGAFGSGMQIISKKSLYPGDLIGHYGDALGLRAGAWFDQTNATSFAYCLNGFPAEEVSGDEEDFFPECEVELFQAIGRTVLGLQHV